LNPKYYAKNIIKELEITNVPVNLTQIANVKDIKIEEVDAEGFEGILIVQNNSAVIGVNRKIRESGRKKFTIAHELGHYHIPGHISNNKQNFSCTSNNMTTYDGRNRKEYEANEFASELLMPEEIFKEKIKYEDLSYKMLQNLTEEFDTTLTATGRRYVEFSGYHAMVFSTNSEITWFSKGEDFPYYISPGKLSEDSVAIDFFKNEEVPNTFQSVLASAWLDDYRLKDDMEIEELSSPLPYYNSVLSFLYSENEEEEY
jgi:Zn-dependent peptidase ImmA (M78 family)